VHISVRAESRHGKRLNPRKADLHRWRETFAEKLRGWGVEAEATRQASRGNTRNYEPLWRVKAGQDGRLLKATRARFKASPASLACRVEAAEAWSHIAKALAASADPGDRSLAQAVARFVRETPAVTPASRENGRVFVREQGKPTGPAHER
jgi:hypothetical protein